MKLSYLQQGFGAGLPLILLHPFPLNSRFWVHQLTGLSHQRHVIAPNFRGYGATRIDAQDEISIKSFASDVCKTLDNLQIPKAIFAGCSMGGYVLFELWRQTPQLVAGMAFIDTRAEADTVDARNKRREQIEHVREVGTADLPDMAAGLLSETSHKSKPSLERDIRSWAIEPECATVIKTLEMLADRPNSVPTLATINVPTLILLGEDDPVVTEQNALVMQEGIKDSVLKTIPNTGHFAPMENPAVVNARLSEFLDRIPTL